MRYMDGTCNCQEDGYCPRYGREMRGRFREICRGINVDLGTAAAFREQWTRESGPIVSDNLAPIPLLLKTHQAPGDAVVMTAAIYSLHRAYPGRYVTAVESYWPDVFQYNPDVPMHLIPSGSAGTALGVSEVQMHYPAIHQSNERSIHFMQAWCEFLGAALGVVVPLLTNHPRLYFNTPSPPVEDFWLVCSGGKSDFTNKLWGHDNYQKVVDLLNDKAKFVQVGGAKPIVRWDQTFREQEDSHPRLGGTVDMVGKTTLRDLFDLVRRCRGVLCGVSLLMHVAAALEKPAIVVAGGREPVAWNVYPRQQYVHTVGALPCRSAQGRVGQACWRSRVVPLGDGTIHDRDTCERPAAGLPQCMQMISPESVAELVFRYN